MNIGSPRIAVALLLRLAALTLLVLAAVGRPWPPPQVATQVVLLSDRSASIDAAELDRARAEVLQDLRDTTGATALLELEFAGQAAPLRAPVARTGAASQSRESIEPLATDLEAALRQALSSVDATRPAALVVLSDGFATRGDTRRALEGVAAAGVPLLWRTVPPDAAAPRIVAVHAPSNARLQQPIAVGIELGGATARPAIVTVTARDQPAASVELPVAAGALAGVSLSVQAPTPGTLLLDVTLTDAASGDVLDSRNAAAAVDVQPPAALLYVANGAAPLASSLRAGGWTLRALRPSALDAEAGALDRYSGIVLDDVPASAARAATWQSLVAAVREQGTGLLVLGGEHSFAAGGYRDSLLESLLPVQSRAGAPGDSASVAFVVDKSGSMGASAAGVDRFGLAQRAVIESAATLSAQDSGVVIVFDVEAREIVPLQRAADFQRAVVAPWPARPRGGTRLAPALDVAVTRLEGSPPGRRLLVLVTDGFVVDGDDAALIERMARAGIELLALAVGPDADVAALGRLAQTGRGEVLRVSEAAELPSLMRSSLESRRAPIERGRLRVRERSALPFPVAAAAGWPSVAAYAVTSARTAAVVHLESERGDPLLAIWQAGLGRVIAVTSGLGAWTPEWLAWSNWPALAGGLADALQRGGSALGPAVRVVDQAAGLRVEVEAATDGAWSTSGPTEARVRTPAGDEHRLPLAASAPGRWSATLPGTSPGLYSITVVTPEGAQRVAHLRAAVAERGSLVPNAAIVAWQADGLVRPWSAAELRNALATAPAQRSPPLGALALALLLFLLALFAERK
jgi:uncharacterized membrane protein